MVCKSCGKYIPDDSNECPICGTNSPKEKVVNVKKQSEFKICPECGYKNSYKEFYCKSCNCNLNEKMPTEKNKKFLIPFIIVIVLAVLAVGKIVESVQTHKSYQNDILAVEKHYQTTASSKTTTQQTTTTAYEWKLNTNSTGKDWNSVNDTEKDVWCSNSIAAWRLMGYDIPSGVSVSHMHKTLDYFYQNEDCVDVDLTTASESYAIANGVY
ncbi:MAG: zinc ribbon domain-containing protein [Oscillospiraceae bacterium]|nr:zinc ribbon domain-containing protein [Oscillospiraceae bacterium]